MSSRSFFSFIAGAAIGAVVAVLANTEKGKETVKNIKDKANEGFEEMENAFKEYKMKTEATVEQIKAEARAKAAAEAADETEVQE